MVQPVVVSGLHFATSVAPGRSLAARPRLALDCRVGCQAITKICLTRSGCPRGGGWPKSEVRVVRGVAEFPAVPVIFR